MKLCFSCHHLTAESGSKFCQGCGRSWKLVCAGCGHEAADRQAKFCPHCGEGDWVAPTTFFFDLRYATGALAVMTALGLWRYGMEHAGLLAGQVLHGALLILAFALGTTIGGVVGAFMHAAIWLVLLWLLGCLLDIMPGNGGFVGSWLRDLPRMLLRQAGKGGLWLLGIARKNVGRAILPPPQERGKQQLKRGEK